MILHTEKSDRLIQNTTKIYPRFVQQIVYKQNIIQTPNETIKPKLNKQKQKETNQHELLRSLRRTKTTMQDIIISNDFTHFATFTFNPKKINRYDNKKLKKVFFSWLKYQKKISPDFIYLAIPEYHKDFATHFHALLKNCRTPLEIATNPKTNKPLKTQYKQQIYNINSWSYGHTTYYKIKNLPRYANYLKKYMTKDLILQKHYHRYYCSKNLIRPETINNAPLLKDAQLQFENAQLYILKKQR